MNGWSTLEIGLPIPQRPRSARFQLALAVLRRRASVRVVFRVAEGTSVYVDSVTMATASKPLHGGPSVKVSP